MRGNALVHPKMYFIKWYMARETIRAYQFPEASWYIELQQPCQYWVATNIHCHRQMITNWVSRWHLCLQQSMVHNEHRDKVSFIVLVSQTNCCKLSQWLMQNRYIQNSHMIGQLKYMLWTNVILRDLGINEFLRDIICCKRFHILLSGAPFTNVDLLSPNHG